MNAKHPVVQILEGLEAKGWKPCACDGAGQEILFKREWKAEKKE